MTCVSNFYNSTCVFLMQHFQKLLQWDLCVGFSILVSSLLKAAKATSYDKSVVQSSSAVPGARWILHGLEKLMSWACMSFKPAESWSLVLKRVRVTNKFRLRVGGDQSPPVTEKPVKSLGKVFNCSLDEGVCGKTWNTQWLRDTTLMMCPSVCSRCTWNTTELDLL